MLSEQEILNKIKCETLDVRDIPNNMLTKSLAIQIFNITREYNVSFNKYLNDIEFVMLLLKKDIYSVNKFFYFINNKKMKNEIMKYLEENNYILDIEDSPSDFLYDKIIIYNTIKKTKNSSLINHVLIKEIDDDLANLLIELNYKPSSISPSSIFTNEILMLYFMKMSINYFENASSNAITDKTIEYAFSNGFKINKDSKLLGNTKILKYVASNYPYLINFAQEDAMNDEIASIAANNGFKYEFHGQRYDKLISTDTLFSDSIEYLEASNNLFLLNYPQLVLSTYTNGYPKIIFQEIIKDNKYMDYMINETIKNKLSIESFRNENIINNEKISKYIFDNYFSSELSKNILSILFTIYPYKEVLYNLDKISILLNDNFINEYGILNTLMIIKYLIIPGDKIDITSYSFEELSYINYILKKLIDTSQLFVLNFKKYINYFSSNKELLHDIMNNKDNLTLNDYININSIIESNIECNGINNIEQTKYNYYDKLNINTKDKVSLYLFGTKYNDIIYFLNTKLNSNKIKVLDKKGIIISKEIEIIINYLERFIKFDDKTYENIWNNINSYPIYSMNRIKEYTKNLYYELYKNEITSVKRNNASYYIDNIPVYEFKGEDFSFLVHSLNAFSTGYGEEKTIFDSYTNNYGKSYLCTSFINQYHLNTASTENSHIFGYNYFSKEQMLAMDNKTIRSNGSDNNNLDVYYKSNVYYDPLEMGLRSSEYNEIDFYRQNNDGVRMTPSCMIFFDKIGDISIAKKLNLPVVVIYTKYYKEDFLHQRLEKIKEEIKNGNMVKLNEYLGLSLKLNNKIDIEELNELLISLKDNDIELCNYILESYNIQKQLTLKKDH